jgi:tRNA threonylcarbamoyladenosine biosynthesis protein TsaE
MTFDNRNINQAARRFIPMMNGHRIFAFHGDMGAGKTTFIKAVCEELGVKDVINSPTFAIVNEYRAEATGRIIYHFDFYRINSADEIENLGIPDYLHAGDICFIEWPEKTEEWLPEDTCHVFIRENADGTRTLDLR